MHGVQSVTLIMGFIHGQRIFFTLCDRRSEGVVPANTLKRLIRKKEILKNIFVFRGRIRTPTDEEKYNHNSEALSTELL